MKLIKLIFRPKLFSYPQKAKFRLKNGKYFYVGFASNFGFEMPYRSQKGPNYKCLNLIKLIFRPKIFSYSQRAKFRLKYGKYFYVGFASNFGFEMPYRSQKGPNYKCLNLIKLIFRPKIFSYSQRAKFRLKLGKYFYAGFASNFGFEMPYRSQKGPNYKCLNLIKLIFRPKIFSYLQRAKFRLKSGKYFSAGFASNFGFEMPYRSQKGHNYKCLNLIKLIFRPKIFLYPQRAKFWLKSGKYFYAKFASNFGFEMPYRSQKGPNY